ncbi:hypothetical protein FJ872_30215, partial [Mesorhizobium sp. B2-5-9]
RFLYLRLRNVADHFRHRHAMALAEAGCDIVVNGRNAELVAKTAAELRQRHGAATAKPLARSADDGLLSADTEIHDDFLL